MNNSNYLNFIRFIINHKINFLIIKGTSTTLIYDQWICFNDFPIAIYFHWWIIICCSLTISFFLTITYMLLPRKCSNVNFYCQNTIWGNYVCTFHLYETYSLNKWHLNTIKMLKNKSVGFNYALITCVSIRYVIFFPCRILFNS